MDFLLKPIEFDRLLQAVKEVKGLLPQQFFVRIDFSYILAIKHKDTVKVHCVIIDGNEIPISSNYREGFLAIIDNK